jgi:hypothetical protein
MFQSSWPTALVSKRSKKEKFQLKNLGRWRLIDQFRERLAPLCLRLGLAPTFQNPNRQLQIGEYLGLFLFGLLNPAVRTMRALCAASHIQRIQEDICGRPVSLGSFSETQAVIDPALLQAVFCQLSEEIHPQEQASPLLKENDLQWLIVDSTLWEALPRMHWALWRRQGTSQSAVRLHLGLHLLDDKPVRASVTTGRGCERKAWKENWLAGDAYVGDRYFGQDYKLFSEMDELGCAFVLRLREEASMEIVEELPLTQADIDANVLRSAWVYLGCKKKYRSMRVRVVWVQTPAEVLLLVTNQSPEQLGADLVAELYRRRWQVELYFRWIKCILGNRHWLAESPEGVTLQIYLALIASLLLQLHTGQRPNKRMMELIQLHLMGVATLEELEAGIERQLARIKAAKSKKSGSHS